MKYKVIPICIGSSAAIGVLLGIWLSYSFCTYPDDVPCNATGFAFAITFTTILSVLCCGLPLLYIAIAMGWTTLTDEIREVRHYLKVDKRDR